MAEKKNGTTRRSGAGAARKTTRTARKGTAARKTTAGAARGRRAAAVAEEPYVPAADGSAPRLVIVESPAKAKTIGKYLGRGYRVKATVGHIMDLPPKKLGIDTKTFDSQLEPIAGKEKTIADIKNAAREASEILVATDPDREGEAIAAHVADQVGRARKPIRRVLFHEITREAVQRAVAAAGEIDRKKVEAQQARRLLDRLVGYQASPLLWKTVKTGLSAGRVQTVALRLIVEREREIRAFVPVEYWTVEAQLEKDGQRFSARLHQIDGKKAEIGKEGEASRIVSDVRAAAERLLREGRAGAPTSALGLFPVTDVKRRERRKNPAAPFTTSTLQQEAAKKLGFGSKRTMRVAQSLYEGVELGAEGAVGLITYMRTDSTRVAESAASAARDYLRTLFGAEFLANGPQLYGKSNAQNAQDAHEGIRPTDPTRRPDAVRRYLNADQLRLYELIWQRFMASQMAPAVFDTTTVDYDLAVPARGAGESASGALASDKMDELVRAGAARTYQFRSTGSIIKFQGFLALYREAREQGDGKALEDEQALPVMEPGERVPVLEVTPSQHFTEPPPRFSEASLVKELERLGIGRPSTYASIISVLLDRHYVQLESRRFSPTPLGETVEKVMVKQFPDIFDVGFTSTMESELDKIEEGSLTWRRVLQDFYGPFETRLENVDLPALIGTVHDLSAVEKERCPNCGGRLLVKGGFFGPYIACENQPRKKCTYTKKLGVDRKPARPTDEKCHECGAPMVIRTSRGGEFLGCSRFPKCRGTRPMPLGVKCPKDGGELTQRRTKQRGKTFYGCANYPACDFVVWDKPVPDVCPECGYVGAEAKKNKTRGEYRKCLKCGNEWDVAAPEEALAG